MVEAMVTFPPNAACRWGVVAGTGGREIMRQSATTCLRRQV